ncbi:MAG TPA: hypothetical protein VLA82_06515 [Actinomycetota bacterium]|nr:hypothetical protein [Actinomycetota bacterium]
MDRRGLLHDADALARDEAFVVLHGFTRIDVSGVDAVAWLHDLLTADIASLADHGAVRSFVLTPTGRIRAEVRVIRRPGSVELVERSDEATSIASILAPYVLSSDVTFGEPEAVALVAVPGATQLPHLTFASATPSMLGDGLDVVSRVDDVDAVRRALSPRREVSPEAAEALRIRLGIPRWRVDLHPDSFPVGAGVDAAMAFAKGCYLGQEAVARIRNLGHPPTVVRHLTTAADVRVGAAVVAPGGRGEVTSAAPADEHGGTVVLARVAHGASAAPLALEDGTPLHDAGTIPSA